MALVWLAAAWIAGIVAGATVGGEARPLAIALALCTLAVAVVRRDARLVVYAVALPALFLFGLARYEAARPSLAGDAVAHYNDGAAERIRGVLRDDPRVHDTSQSFAVSVREVRERGEWVEASGGVLVRTALLPRHRSGDVVELEGRLETPPALDGFDYAEYLSRRGIGSVMDYPALRLVGHDDDNILRATVLQVRRRLSGALALALPEPHASLAQGVLLGERPALPRDVLDDLNTTNTAHLVVVSGGNMVLVSSYVTLLFAWAVGRRRALGLSMLTVVAYALLVGASPPVLRATIMGLLLIVAQLTGRPSSGVVSITLAAAAMAGLDPGVVRDVSFQLSFAASTGIIWLAAPLRGWAIALTARALRREEVPRWTAAFFAEPLAVTVAAVVATAPLLMLNFGRLSLVALPANLLVVPAFPLILGASLLAAIGGMVPHAHLALGAPAYYALSYWLAVADGLAALPGAAASVGGYSTAWTAATYAAIVAGSLALLRASRRPLEARLAESRPLTLRSLRAPVALAVPALVLATSVGWVLWPPEPARLRVTVLDVGQGDAILIEGPDGRDILVDGGPGRAVLRGLGEELSWRDRSIELMVLTHPQADHVTGLIDVLARYDVRAAIAGPGSRASVAARTWEEGLGDEGAAVRTVTRGETIDLGRGARMEVLSPDWSLAASANANNRGVVLRVVWGEVSFLLAADIEVGAEEALVDSGVDLRSTVLKVAHHGSKTSSGARFLAAVQPSVSVVSAGEGNPFGHPDDGASGFMARVRLRLRAMMTLADGARARDGSVMGRLRSWGRVYVTAADGAVRFETDGRRLWVDAER